MCKPATVLLLAILTALPCSGAKAPPQTNNVLVLHLGWQRFPLNQIVDAQIQEVFAAEQEQRRVQVFDEYLDERRLGVRFPEIAEALQHKYSSQKFDLIIAVGSPALKLLLTHGQSVFGETPAVFMMVGERELPESGLPPSITGITRRQDFSATLGLALRLQPETRHVFVVSGSSEFSRLAESAFQQDVRGFSRSVDFTYINNLALDDLLSTVSHLPENSMVFYLVLDQDAAGRSHIPAQVGHLISVSANAPVYGIVQTYVGQGIVGGSVVNLEKTARAGAQLGLRILSGEHVQDIPVEQGPANEVQVDWQQLQRWHIPESKIPPGAIVVNREPGVWERYHALILGAALILLIQTLLIMRMFLETRLRRDAEKTIARRKELEKLVSDVSSRVIEAPAHAIPSAIQDNLEQVRQVLGIDRVSLFERLERETEFQHLYSAATSGAFPAPAIFHLHNFPWMKEMLLSGNSVLLDSAETTPATAALERASVKQKGVQWVGIVPLLSGQEVRGLTVFLSMKGERFWTYEQVPQLQILGDIFYQAVLRKRAFEEVQETERRFALVADNAPMLIWMADTDKNCTYVNRRWLDFMGDTLEQELGVGWTANLHPEDRACCLKEYEEAFDARKEIRMEYRVQRRDGEYRWIMDYGVPRYSPAGAFCGYIGSSLDITDLKRSEEELGKVSGRLIHAQEEERRRIARELHDDFTQRLAALGMELAQLGQETPAKEALQQRLKEVGGKLREITMGLSATAHQLHSSHLELIGLAASAQRLCSDFSQQNGIHVDFQQSNIPKNLPPEAVLCLYRVLQEALHNVARHSRATSCQVRLRRENRSVLLTVSDAGAGFDPAHGERNGGIGLISMRERVRLAGGELQLHSRPEEGTRLEARVPLPAEPEMTIGEHDASEAEPQSA